MVYRKYTATSLMELVVALCCICLILAPAIHHKFHSLQILQQTHNQHAIQQQAYYIFMLLEDEMAYSTINEETLPSADQTESSLLAFTRRDGKYVRYYLRNGEIVKDYNYSIYNAVSYSCFIFFRVHRKDLGPFCVFTVQLIGKDGYEYQQSFNLQKS